MDSAEALAREGGLSAMTMRTVGGSLGISSMTIYLYFKSRDDLLGQIAARGYTSLIAALGEASTSPDARERLESLTGSYLTWSRANSHLFEVMHSEEAAGHPQVQERQAQVASTFAAIVKELIGDGASEAAVISGVQCTMYLLVSVVFRTQGDELSHDAADARVLAFLAGGLAGLKAAA